MIEIGTFTDLAMGFEEAVEQPHFHKSSFRVRKKIFATLDVNAKTAVLKFSPHEQSIFVGLGQGSLYPVKGAWGDKGWTEVDFTQVSLDVLKFALTTSYCGVAPKALAQKYSQD